ncbi:hypothetical protein EDD22DRAFT_884216 [Suillus occidentalis]|nr:hypothetical protein EDD22DRAFT_884216 [Suillus occidentalis]
MIIMQQLWLFVMTIPLHAAGVGYRYLLRTCAVTHIQLQQIYWRYGTLEDDERDDWVGEEHFSGNMIDQSKQWVCLQCHFCCPEFEKGSFHDGDIAIWQI